MGGKKGGASRGTGMADSWTWTMRGIHYGSEENRVGESNGEKTGTTVTEQQLKKKTFILKIHPFS